MARASGRCHDDARRRHREAASSTSSPSPLATPTSPSSSPSRRRAPRRVAHPVLATFALLMLASGGPHGRGANAAVNSAAPGSPTMGCWRNAAKGVAARCVGFVDVGPRQAKLFTFTIPPRDVDNRAYDIEVSLETEGGDLDL